MNTAADGGGPGRPSMHLTVPRDKLYLGARRFEEIADNLESWTQKNRQRFFVQAAGAEEVSIAAARWFTDMAVGPDGLYPAVQEALVQLRGLAAAMRASAEEYGLTDHSTAENLSAQDRT